MRRIFFGLLFSLWVNAAVAGINCPLPFALTNGTTADASQVMANYNALVTCLGLAAGAGANTDITSILGLTTPLGTAGGGSSWFNGGTSTGSANAQVVGSLTPNSYTLTAKNFVSFVAGFTNNGPTTINVGGTGAVTVKIPTTTGLQTLAGGEIVTGQVSIAYYDGTQYELLNGSPQALVPACTTIDYEGVVVPSGYLAENGQAVSRATFVNLFNCLNYTAVAATTTNGNPSILVADSTIFQVGWSVGGTNVTCNSTIVSKPDGTHININNNAGASGATTLSIGPQPQGDCSTTFNIPDKRGRADAAADTSGSNLSAVACPNPASIGTRCGSTTQVIANANLPASIPYTDPGHAHRPSTDSGQQFVSTTGVAAHSSGSPDFTSAQTTGGANSNTGIFTTSVTTGLTINQGGANTPLLLQPIALVTKAIKF